MAFGEVLYEEHSSSFVSPYLYNAKELDRDTNLYYYGARYYDPKVSVFLNVDPLAEKYPNIGGYVYVMNNPINFVDPDGRKIVIPNIVGKNINGPDNSKQRAVILSNIQKLTNEKLELVKVSEGYEVRKVGKETMNSEKKLTNGTKLIRDLVDSDKSITVELGERNRIIKYDSGTSKVFFNPDDKGDMIMNEDGTTGRPIFIGLGHELIHADENVKGTVDHTKIRIINPDGTKPGEVVEIKQDELNVRKREEGLRDEHNIKQRKTPQIEN